MQKSISALSLLFAVAVVCPAQESRATLIGRATDPTGALIAGALVHATNTATNTTLSSTTNEGGNFEIPYLLPGTYNVTVKGAGGGVTNSGTPVISLTVQ